MFSNLRFAQRVAAALFALSVGFAPGLMAPDAVQAAAQPCQCLVYFQRATGLPATGNANFQAQNYANFLATYRVNSKLQYRVNTRTPSTARPQDLNGTYLIFSASRIGGVGHIAIVQSAQYDAKSRNWTFTFQDANGGWTGNQLVRGPFTANDCSNVKIAKLVTPSLSGLTFFTVARA